MFMSSAQFGEMISKKLGGQKMGLTAAVDLSNREINRVLDDTLKSLDLMNVGSKDAFDNAEELDHRPTEQTWTKI